MTRIRDPIHGSIQVDDRERAVLDSPFMQRLRGVRQLGFSELAFPGATHTRYAHALGACHVVGRLFDAIYDNLPNIGAADRERLRAAVRVAMMLHDSGHAPFSHSSEAIMPPREQLGLPAWTAGEAPAAQASHEDFTLLVLLQSELSDVLRDEFGGLEVTPEAIASLIAGRDAPGGPWFRVGGVDHGPLLRKIVSSELDADRMDYLLRDSFYTGVNYGKYDLEWLAGQLRAWVHGDAADLCLRHRGVFAFEDFLLSRYHMFISVYYHHTPVGFDRMLWRFYEECPKAFEIPSTAEGFLDCDDLALVSALRASDNSWATRIIRRRPYRCVLESNPYRRDLDVVEAASRLEEVGIDHFTTRSRGMVSKYFGAEESGGHIWVSAPDGDHVPLEEYTPLFRRYEREALIDRVYVEPEREAEARSLFPRED